MVTDKNLAAYVKHLHENGYLLNQELIAAQCIRYDWITVTVNDAWDITYELTALGEIALGMVASETPDGSRAIGEREADSGEVEYEVRRTQDGLHWHIWQFVGNNEGTPLMGRYPTKLAALSKMREMKELATPQPAASREKETGAGEYTFTYGKGVHQGNRIVATWRDFGIREIAEVLNEETATLRAENARLQDDLKAKQEMLMSYAGDVTRMSARIRELETVIQNAYNKLAQYSGVEFDQRVIAAKEMLDRYTKPKND